MTDQSNTKMPLGVVVKGEITPAFAEILTPEALDFVAKLQRAFGTRRIECLTRRQQRQMSLDRGEALDFLPETKQIREGDWKCGPIPADIQDRRVEITGPTDRKMVINALNSGAKIFMADFEDANSPTWGNMVEGQINLRDAIRRTITFTNPEGKEYKLNEKGAVLFVRPRGWHLLEKHVLVDGEPVAGALFDFGLFFFHNAKELIRRRSGPYFYLPKMESHLEARIWNDAFKLAQEELGIPQGTIRATVLDRDDSGGLRNGRNSLRAARAFRRAELRPLGLHFFLHQKVPEQARLPARRSRAHYDDNALHAFVFAALYKDLPSAGHICDGRNGGSDSGEERSGGERSRPSRKCARTRNAKRAMATTEPGSHIPAWCSSRERLLTR